MKRHGSELRPPNRFQRVRAEPDPEHWLWAVEEFTEDPSIEYLTDASRTIVTENHSPDVPFRYSVNPYRGCAHGCAYCYARNSHEYLGFNAGIDFETKIVVKHNAPKLLREFLARQSWQPEPIIFSGVTDCYQPAEREFRLTRGCLEVAAWCRQPISLVTKNALVVRDLDLLQDMAERNLVHVNISLTTLDSELARVMEPRTSTPAARLRAMMTLAEAGVPVRVLTAPIIPGLNDAEIPALLRAARDAGADDAGLVLLRLPLTVEPVFVEWIQRAQPNRAERVLNTIRHTRRGELNQSGWGERMTGSGLIAEQISLLHQTIRGRLGFPGLGQHDCSQFRRPGQLRLF